MNRMKIVTLLLFVLALIFVIFLSSRGDNFEPEVEFQVNQITGEVTRTTNNVPEQAGAESIVLYGFSPLADSLSFVQTDIFRQSTYSYLLGLYNTQVPSVTIIPESISFEYPSEREQIISFTMIIENQDDRFDVTLRTLALTGLEIEYKSSDAAIPVYSTGPIINTPDIESDYTGDGVPPEER